jgi:energy-coupling factor transporter ATP-binding protein EcfA2
MPDVFRKLKPLYGRRVDILWLEYQTADVERKREIDALLTLLAAKRFGSSIGEERLILDAPPADLIGRGDFTLGDVAYPSLAPYPFRVARNELLRHVFILGPTGSGKSTLLLGLLMQLQAAGVPFVVFDFKRNYRCLLHLERRRTVVFTVGRSTAPLALNVLAPPAGVSFEEWADALTDIIGTAYLLMQGARNVLKESLLAAHRSCGDAARLVDAFTLLQAELDATRAGSRRYGWLESSARSLEELTKGGFGEALNATSATRIEDVFDYPVVFELHGFGEDQKRFFCLYVLQSILLLRKNGSARREELQHVLVFDEAHNVFPKERLGEQSVPARLAREVREYGEAIIAATQQADVSESLIANSGFKFILRCDFPRDVQFASALLQIEGRWLPKLPLGHCIARLPVRFYSPFEFTYSDSHLKNLPTSEEMVRSAWSTHDLRTSAPVASAAVAEREETLLRDVNEQPIAPITERYARLGWNPKVGNSVKDAVIGKRLATFEAITTPTGVVKILSLTDAGRALLVTRGVDVTRSRHGGVEHEYWKYRVRLQLERRGYTVAEEQPVGGGKTVDVYGKRGDAEVWVEVETGRSDVGANIAKLEQLSGCKVVFLTDAAVRSTLPPLPEGFSIVTPADLVRVA